MVRFRGGKLRQRGRPSPREIPHPIDLNEPSTSSARIYESLNLSTRYTNIHPYSRYSRGKRGRPRKRLSTFSNVESGRLVIREDSVKNDDAHLYKMIETEEREYEKERKEYMEAQSDEESLSGQEEIIEPESVYYKIMDHKEASASEGVNQIKLPLKFAYKKRMNRNQASTSSAAPQQPTVEEKISIQLPPKFAYCKGQLKKLNANSEVPLSPQSPLLEKTTKKLMYLDINDM